MQVHVNVGQTQSYELRHAILVYRGTNQAFATLHEIRKSPDSGAPYLAAGQLLTTSFLKTLAEGLGRNTRPEILPETVLARAADMIVWWSRAQRRIMFFSDHDPDVHKLNGRVCPHPALVFKAHGSNLFVRALSENARPNANTKLKTAPYWNTRQEDGLVCVGTARIPHSTSVESVMQWECSYFESSFTHPYGAARLTTFPGGFAALWSTLSSGRESFPVKFLTDGKQTLRDFVESS
jgi:PRTRC genetic system protein B